MSTFYRLLTFLRPYKRGLSISWLLASGAMVMTVLVPALTGLAVDALKKGATHAQHHELAARDHDRHRLLVLAGLILAAVLVRWALMYWRRLIAGRVSLGIEYDLRERLYGHLQRLELGFFDRQQTGQLMSRATVDLQAVRFFLGYGLVFILQSILTIALAAIAMFIVNAPLALIAVIPVPFVVVISYRYGYRARPAIQETQQRIGELTADAEESISGVRVIKSFAREPRQLKRFRHSVGRVFSQAMVATRLEATYNPVIGFLPQLGLAAVLLLGGEKVIHTHLTLGQFTAFYLYVSMLITPMRSLGVMLNLAQRATASGARIFQVLDRAPRLTSLPGAPALPAGNGHVQLRGVSLRYDESDDFGAAYSHEQASRAGSSSGDVAASDEAASPAHGSRTVLRDVNLDVPAGRTIALVGATGSGKTSLVSLISRLYDVSDGAVMIDGADVRDVDLRSVHGAVAVVSDDPFLFSATVAENIAYARPTATQQEIELAAQRAQAHEFIARLPDGMQTRVGERGLDALRRTAPATGDRTRAAGRPARADPRRRHVLGGLLDRAPDQACAGRSDGRPHNVHRRPPPFDDRARR